jgi:hypothetical protein
LKTDCRNDCVEVLRFPKIVFNRPGLPHICYRIGTYSDFRESLLRKLDQNAVLQNWTHREPDDPGIALLEGVSILGDILTFYQETYANEVYLRTAVWRESISGIVKLLGYRLSPGLGGTGTFAFEVKGDKSVNIPSGFPLKAQITGTGKQENFETANDLTAYPWLNKFNLFRELVANPVTPSVNEFYISSPDQFTELVKIEKNDRLLIGDPYPQNNPKRLINEEIVIVDSIRQQHGVNIIKIKGSLKRKVSSQQVTAYKLGRSFKHFGNNAPPTVVTITNNTANQKNISYTRYLDQTTSINVDPPIAAKDFLLDSEVNNLATGSLIICQSALKTTSLINLVYYYLPIYKGAYNNSASFTLIRKIADLKAASLTFGSLTGKSSILTLDSELTSSPIIGYDPYDPFSSNYDLMDIRQAQFHEVVSPKLILKAVKKETTEHSGNKLYFYGTTEHASNLKERKLLFVKPGDKPFTANVISVEENSTPGKTRKILNKLTLDKNFTYSDFPNENGNISVYGNLVDAAQGKSEKEVILGNGDSRQKFQTFKIPKSPLTFLNSVSASPPELPELKIYVNDRLWTKVSSFFGREPDEDIYIVREDNDGNSYVQFGDGKTGKRLPSGLNNITAKYRIGTGAFGELKDGTTVQPSGKSTNIDKVQLPGTISGGEEPESLDNARESAPGTVQSLNRLVSIKDFETEALGIAGVIKAKSFWKLFDNLPGVLLIILMKSGRENEIQKIKEIISKYNKCRGPQRFPVIVHQGKLKYLYLDVTVSFNPSFKKDEVINDIKEAVGVNGDEKSGIDGSNGLFGLKKRSFGQNEYSTNVEAVIQEVKGVNWVKVTAMDLLSGEDNPEDIFYPPSTKEFYPIIRCDNENILSLYKKHFVIKEASGDSKEEC